MNHIRIMFVQFQPTKEVMQNMMKASRANMGALEEDECKETK